LELSEYDFWDSLLVVWSLAATLLMFSGFLVGDMMESA
jgi:hypothetical protein